MIKRLLVFASALLFIALTAFANTNLDGFQVKANVADGQNDMGTITLSYTNPAGVADQFEGPAASVQADAKASSTVYLAAMPATGYVFDKWTIGGMVIDQSLYEVDADGIAYLEFAITCDTTVIAHFKTTPTLEIKPNSIMMGRVVFDQNIIYVNDLSTQEAFEQFTVIDANSDGCTWLWDVDTDEYEDTVTSVSYYFDEDNDADDWLVSPSIHLTAGKTYEIMIMAATGKTYNERFEMVAATGATLADMENGTTIMPPTMVNAEYGENYFVFFTPQSDGDYNIGIHCISDADMHHLDMARFRVMEWLGEGVGRIDVNKVRLAARGSVTVIAIPDEGYELAGWSNGAEANSALSTTVNGDTLSDDMVLSAIFVPKQFTLTLNVNDTTMGIAIMDETRIALDEPFDDLTTLINEGDNCSWSVVTEHAESNYTPHSGTHFAFIGHCSNGRKTKFRTGSIDLESYSSATLNFWYINRSWRGDIDALTVYYRTSSTDEWTPLFSTSEGHGTWTECTISLPNLSDDYEIAFESTDHYGYGIGIDDILVTTISSEMPEGITDNHDGTYTIDYGTEIDIKAISKTCYRFDSWSNGGSTTANQRYIYITCDTAITANFTVNEYSGTDSRTACDSLVWHDSTYTQATTSATFTDRTIEGCDSIVTLRLTLRHSNASTDIQTSCDNLTWHGSTYYASTTDAIYTTTNIEGCDSVITLNLTLFHSTDTTISAQARDSYSWMGETFAESGSYTRTIPSVMGCDSVITLILTVTNATTPLPVLHNMVNVMLVVNHNPNGLVGVYYAYYRWYRDGVIVKEGVDADAYDEGGRPLHGCYSLEVAFDAALTYWARTDNLCIGTTGIATASDLQFTLSPNPATHGQQVGITVSDDINNLQASRLEIFDAHGRQIINYELNNSKFAIPSSQFAAGIYAVRLTLTDGRTATRRLIVK